MKYLILSILICLLFHGCASVTPVTKFDTNKYSTTESRSCAELITQVELSIYENNVTDSQARRIGPYPYLRVNRFLSEFRFSVLDKNEFEAWLERMQHLALKGWSIEINNLPASSQKQLNKFTSRIIPEKQTLSEALEMCTNTLRAIDLDDDAERLELIKIAKVEDEYNDWQRLIGLYPITAWFFKFGIIQWHKKTIEHYTIPFDKLTTTGKLIRYTPEKKRRWLTEIAVSSILKSSTKNRLAIPELTPLNKQKLFDNFAPVFEIDMVSNDDRIGEIIINDKQHPVVNTNNATVYQYVSYTHYHDQVLLQLNYTIWFPARPKTSNFDLLGGHLDGITWRVTLLPNGKVWFYDTIHNCGCYYMIFPTHTLGELPNENIFEEPVLIPQVLTDKATVRPHIRIANGTHYIERIHFKESGNTVNQHYQLAEYDTLRSLPLNNGAYKSIFSNDGIIYSSTRNERFLFWPMGIPSPGAMRQAGHHLTAFVGKRHFDDARLFENLFSKIVKDQ